MIKSGRGRSDSLAKPVGRSLAVPAGHTSLSLTATNREWTDGISEKSRVKGTHRRPDQLTLIVP